MGKWLPRLSGLSPADGKTQGYPWRASRRVTPGREKEKTLPQPPGWRCRSLFILPWACGSCVNWAGRVVWAPGPTPQHGLLTGACDPGRKDKVRCLAPSYPDRMWEGVVGTQEVGEDIPLALACAETSGPGKPASPCAFDLLLTGSRARSPVRFEVQFKSLESTVPLSCGVNRTGLSAEEGAAVMVPAGAHP